MILCKILFGFRKSQIKADIPRKAGAADGNGAKERSVTVLWIWVKVRVLVS